MNPLSRHGPCRDGSTLPSHVLGTGTVIGVLLATVSAVITEFLFETLIGPLSSLHRLLPHPMCDED